MNAVINQFLCYVGLMIPAYFHVVAMEQITDPEERKFKKITRYLAWNIFIGIGIGIRVIINDQPKTQTFMPIYGMLGFLIFLCIFYRGKFWKKVIITIVISLGTVMSEIMIMVFVSQSYLQSMGEWDFRNTQIMFITLLGALFSSLGIWLVVVVWKRVILAFRTPKYAFFFCIYMVILMLPFTKVQYLLVEGVLNPLFYYSMLTAIVCGITFAFIVFYEIQKNDLQEVYQETSEKRKLETIHFEEISRQRQALEKITKENSYTMKEIDELLEKEQTEDAEYMIMKLLKRIEATREYPYCSIPVINVILTEKQKECEENGIELKMDINLQEELRMKQTDLCSAFANILDNAVRSCKQLTEHGVDQVTCIKLKVGMNRNYLIIRCENSYKKEFGKFREGSGLGLKILRDIARCYDGDLKMEQKEEVFVSQLSLKNHS